MNNIYAHFLIDLDNLLESVVRGETIDVLMEANKEVILRKKDQINFTREDQFDYESKITEKIIFLLSESPGNCAIINLFKVFVNAKEKIGGILINKATHLDVILLKHLAQNIKAILENAAVYKLEDLKLLLLYVSSSFKNSEDLIEIVIKKNGNLIEKYFDASLEIFLTNIIWSSLMNFPDTMKHFTSTKALNQILISNEVFMSRLDTMNDPKEGKYFYEVAKTTRGYTGIPNGLFAYNLSFTTSEDFKQIPMWSLYTKMDGARMTYINWLFNYALLFYDENDKLKMPIAGNVLYGKTKILAVIRWLNRLVKAHPKLVKIRDFVFRYLPFFSKVKDYSYEEEYRVIHIFGADQGKVFKVNSPILKLPYKFQWSPDLDDSFGKRAVKDFFRKSGAIEETNKLNWRKNKC